MSKCLGLFNKAKIMLFIVSTSALCPGLSIKQKFNTVPTFDEACEEERLPSEEELLMERVEADSSLSWDSRVATLLIES